MRKNRALPLAVVVFVAVAIIGCADRPREAAPDTHNKTTPAVPSQPSRPERRVLELIVAVPGEDNAVASLLGAGATEGIDRLELFTGTARDTVTMSRGTNAPACARLSSGSDRVRTIWTIAFPVGVVDPLAADSLAQLRGRDSLALAVSVARLASRVPGDTDAALRGLPYVVRGAWVFAGDSGRSDMVAVAQRTLSMEADPRAEMLVIFADRQSGTADWSLRLGVRNNGPESAISVPTFRGVFRSNATGAFMTFVERGDDGDSVLELFERNTAETWTSRWVRPIPTCGR